MIDGAKIRSARAARGWSQSDLMAAMRTQAVRNGWTLMRPDSLRGAVSRWENDRHAPDHHYSRLLRAVMPELDRNERLVGEPNVAASVSAATEDSLHSVLAAHVDSCRALDRRFGAPAARKQTTAHVESLDMLWRNTFGADKRTVAYAHAEAASLAAWQDLDVGDLVSASNHYAAAKLAAARAEDPVRLAHTMGEEAIMLAETGRVRQAVDQVEVATAAQQLPTLLRSWLWATRAQIHAGANSDARAARRALTRAEKLLATTKTAEAPELPFLSHNPVHFARWSGHVLALLSDSAAGPVTRDALSQLPSDFVRARAAQHLDLAQDALNGQRHAEAAGILSASAESIDGLGSVRLRRRHRLLSGRVRSPAETV
ncbi:helix-turn-helix domain-containing protein (plasmid) [Nocardia sp. NBC_01377]|uniref:helix-turn-helix domain-containing protein n=1 Tax=Nocardia sp. NBC_01377 TaxID=2903595 RepID=UPI002F90F009